MSTTDFFSTKIFGEIRAHLTGVIESYPQRQRHRVVTKFETNLACVADLVRVPRDGSGNLFQATVEGARLAGKLSDKEIVDFQPVFEQLVTSFPDKKHLRQQLADLLLECAANIREIWDVDFLEAS